MKSQAEINKMIRQKKCLADVFRQVKTIHTPIELQALNPVDVSIQWTKINNLNLNDMCNPKTVVNWTTITNP